METIRNANLRWLEKVRADLRDLMKFLIGEQEEFLSSVISYVCENGDITKEIVVNEAPFDEQLYVFNYS